MGKQLTPQRELENLLNEFRSTFSNDLMLDTFKPFMTRNGSYPPYNIIREGESTSTIEMALAGFNKDELDVKLDGNILTVSSSRDTEDKKVSGDNGYVYKGIAKRSFSSKFRLSEYPEITECTFRDGILRITVTQNIPEEKLPKAIEIE